METIKAFIRGWPQHTLKEELRTFIGVTMGSLIYAVTVTLFVQPARLPSAGVTGLALFLNYRWGWSLGITSVVMNLALFVYAWRVLSRRFLCWSLYSTVLISLAFEVATFLPLPPQFDPMLQVIVAGVLQGMALAMVFAVGASTGGTDIITMAVKKKTGLEVGSITMVINFAVILLFISEVPMEKILYGMVLTYIMSRVMNSDMKAFGQRKEAWVVTEQVELVRHFIVEELHRGVTIFCGRGGYDGQPRQVMISLLSPRQALHLKNFLKEHDPSAFLRLSEASEVLGQGFQTWKSDV